MVPLIVCILCPAGVSLVYMSGGSCMPLAKSSALYLPGNSFPASGVDCVTVYNGTTQSAKWYNTFKKLVKLTNNTAEAVRQEYPSVNRSRLYITSLSPLFQGLYSCKVVDIDGVTQELFLGMYTPGVGTSVLLLPITL